MHFVPLIFSLHRLGGLYGYYSFHKGFDVFVKNLLIQDCFEASRDGKMKPRMYVVPKLLLLLQVYGIGDDLV